MILIKDEEILLLRRANTGFEDGNYSLPAGHMDGSESATNAMIREAKEELGIQIAQEDLSLIHMLHRDCVTGERVEFFFTADQWSGEIQNCEPKKCDDLTWYPLDELPDNTIPYIRSVIEHIKNGQVYSEFGW